MFYQIIIKLVCVDRHTQTMSLPELPKLRVMSKYNKVTFLLILPHKNMAGNEIIPTRKKRALKVSLDLK